MGPVVLEKRFPETGSPTSRVLRSTNGAVTPCLHRVTPHSRWTGPGAFGKVRCTGHWGRCRVTSQVWAHYAASQGEREIHADLKKAVQCKRKLFKAWCESGWAHRCHPRAVRHAARTEDPSSAGPTSQARQCIEEHALGPEYIEVGASQTGLSHCQARNVLLPSSTAVLPQP